MKSGVGDLNVTGKNPGAEHQPGELVPLIERTRNLAAEPRLPLV